MKCDICDGPIVCGAIEVPSKGYVCPECVVKRFRETGPEEARALLEAVEATEFNGIVCRDVNGVNWFDVRDKLLRTSEDAAVRREEGDGKND